LERIRIIVEQRWGLKKRNEKEESRYDKEGFENGFRESQEERTLLSISY